MFQFRHFSIYDDVSAMKIGTDGVLLGAWAFDEYIPRHILDVGTGTGLISLMLAQRFPKTRITALEICPEAADEARRNIAMSPWASRIDVVTADFNKYTPTAEIDTIISNPPFFDETIYSPCSNRTTARHESALTLDNLIGHASNILPANGRLAFIAPEKRTDELIYKCTLNHLDVERISTVSSKQYADNIRVLLQVEKGLVDSYRSTHLDIRSANGVQYTSTYRQLTENFYLPSTFTK